MNNVSAQGLTLLIKASKTFPAGFQVSVFADDVDPFDIEDLNVAEAAMDMNGNMRTWSTPQPQPMAIAVLPGSDEDDNLTVLLEANTPSKGRMPANDVITIVGMYGNGKRVTAREGVILGGSRGMSVASAGRLKSKAYNFVFQTFDIGR